MPARWAETTPPTFFTGGSLVWTRQAAWLPGFVETLPATSQKQKRVVSPLGSHVYPKRKSRPRLLGGLKPALRPPYARQAVYSPGASSGVVTGPARQRICQGAKRKRPLAGAFGVVIIRSGSGDFFDGRFQQGDTLFDAVDFQIFFVAVEAGADRAKAVQRGDTVG